MADPATEQAIGIVRALHAAGLLRGQAAPIPSGVPMEAGLASTNTIVAALRAAGVIQVQGADAPPPPPGPQVGDVIVVPIRQVAKFVGTKPDTLKVLLTHSSEPTTYELEFPPNDDVFLQEVHRIQPIERPIQIQAHMTVTERFSANSFACEMGGLWVNTGFRT